MLKSVSTFLSYTRNYNNPKKITYYNYKRQLMEQRGVFFYSKERKNPTIDYHLKYITKYIIPNT